MRLTLLAHTGRPRTSCAAQYRLASVRRYVWDDLPDVMHDRDATDVIDYES